MNVDDLKIPIELVEARRDTVLLYALCALHADANGFCYSPRWLGALGGLKREEYDAAREELVQMRLADLFSYDDCYGVNRGIRLLKWKGAQRHERLTWQEWKRVREAVFERDGFTCAYCSTVFNPTDLECDHVEPISQGGTNEMGNLVTACKACNQSKRGNLIELWRRREAKNG